MKKLILILISYASICTVYAQFTPMLNKSKSFIVNAIKKDKGAHSIGFTTAEDMKYNESLGNSTYVNEAWFSKTFKPKGLYAFEAKCKHYFNNENICTEYSVLMPPGYLRYMMAHLQGFSQIDASNFTSYDGKTHLTLRCDADVCNMDFTREYIPRNTIINNSENADKVDKSVVSSEMKKRFGNFDYASKSSTWTCHDAAILKLFSLSGTSKFACKLKYADSLTDGANELLFMLVSLNPVSDNSCHGCSPMLKFLAYNKRGSMWISTNQDFSVQMGSFGETPPFEVKNMGKTIGFLFTPGFTGQGETEESIELYGYYKGLFRKILNIKDSHYDNLGACDSTKLNSCYSYTGKLDILSTGKVFNDVIFTKKGTDIVDHKVVNVDVTETYQFTNGVYLKSTF